MKPDASYENCVGCQLHDKFQLCNFHRKHYLTETIELLTEKDLTQNKDCYFEGVIIRFYTPNGYVPKRDSQQLYKNAIVYLQKLLQ